MSKELMNQEIVAMVSLKDLVPVGQLGYLAGQVEQVREQGNPLSALVEPITDLLGEEKRLTNARDRFKVAVREITDYFKRSDEYVDKAKGDAKAYLLAEFAKYRAGIDAEDLARYGKVLKNYDGFPHPDIFQLRKGAPKVAFNKLDVELNPALRTRYLKLVPTIDEEAVKRDALAGVITSAELPSLKITEDPVVAIQAQKALEGKV